MLISPRNCARSLSVGITKLSLASRRKPHNRMNIYTMSNNIKRIRAGKKFDAYLIKVFIDDAERSNRSIKRHTTGHHRFDSETIDSIINDATAKRNIITSARFSVVP